MLEREREREGGRGRGRDGQRRGALLPVGEVIQTVLNVKPEAQDLIPVHTLVSIKDKHSRNTLYVKYLSQTTFQM